MQKQVHSDTSDGDIAVNISGVSKTFYQRQRSEKLRDIFCSLVRPTVKEVHALSSVDLEVRRGEIIAYAGPNGAGKSTTVKLLSGLLAPDTGKIRVLGMDPVRDRIKLVSRVGVVFGQRTELWWDHPLAASFEWKRVVWDIPRERYDRMLGTVKELLGLGEFFNSLARELSLGQRMRSDLGLALMHEPQILFLDEPTIGVDVLAKRNIINFIKDINREQNVTVMLTSHDMSDLEQLAGRIVMLDHGKVAYDGDFETLRGSFSKRRILVIRTSEDSAPALEGAELTASDTGRHEYTYDASSIRLTDLLEQASLQAEILDVESHRGSIDDVIADIYESWQETNTVTPADSKTVKGSDRFLIEELPRANPPSDD